MKNKLCPLLLAFCLLLCGCHAGTVSSRNEKTVPIDRIAEALRTNSISVYESAFPPTFGEQYRAQYDDMQQTVELLLSAASALNLDRYGEDVRVTYELTDAKRYDTDLLEQYYQVLAIDSFAYEMPLDSVTDASEITLTVYFKGSYHEEKFVLTYTVLCIGGNWYLHPKHFGNVLKP